MSTHMSTSSPISLSIRSLVKASGELRVSLEQAVLPEPGHDEVLIRVLATPINPSDLGWLFGTADIGTAQEAGSTDAPLLTARIPLAGMPAMASRIGTPLPVGNEGAGVVVATGASPEAQVLLGKKVCTLSGGMYAQYRCTKAALCMELPEDVTATEGASCFVNPLTALSLLDAMKRDGHQAVVQTAAASNLGQMVLRICLKDGIEIVNVVRSQAQEELLRSQGARHVFNSTSPTFTQDITACLLETGATAVFDAIAGGATGTQILACIEAAQVSKLTTYSRYGSGVYKHLYIYGNLNTTPTIIDRGGLGASFGVSGFLLMPYLEKIGPEASSQLKRRVMSEIKTTFASTYGRVIPLTELLSLENVRAYSQRITGDKFLIVPNKE
ncbi:zinc-binding dehydrogenase [Polaromonas sp. P1-6]|nr:zinc-binding dehydrogenase [Polaromonas sp. P1-6]